MTRAFLITAGLTILSGFAAPYSSHALSEKEVYDLQARCAKEAEDYFLKYYRDYSYNIEEGHVTAGYTNHYNKKLNKCFIVMDNTFTPNEKHKEKHQITQRFMDDIHENKSYGIFIQDNVEINACVVLDIKCSSVEQWDSLIRPFMTE